MDDLTPLNSPLSEEEKELQEIRERFIRFPKLSRWFDLYFDRDNVSGLNTFLKRTESAIIAYDLNPSDPHDRKTAWEIGSRNASKCKVFAQKYYDHTGMTTEKVLDLIAEKAINTNNAKYLQILADLTGVYQSKPIVAIQNNVVNGISSQVTVEEATQFKKEFAEFIYSKYGEKG